VAPAVREEFDRLSLFVVGRQGLAWSRDRRTMYFVGDANSSKDIWSVSVDPDTLNVTGVPVRVTTALESDLTPTSDRAGGRLAFSTATSSSSLWLLDLDAAGRPDGRARAVTSPELDSTQPALSRDGRRLAFIVHHPGGRAIREIREISLDNGRERILRTYDESKFLAEWAMTPRLSPDGSHLLYSHQEVTASGQLSGIRQLDLTSLVESELISSSPVSFPYVDDPWSWSADGRSVLATGLRYRTGFFNLVRLPIGPAPEAEKAARILVSSNYLRLWQADESADGRWICYNATTRLNDTSAIYVVSANGGEPRRLSDENTWDDKPRWSRDGRSIYFISTRGNGDLNVWSLGFDPATGTATGPAVRITQYSGPNETLGSGDRIEPADISVGGSRMVVPVHRLSGSIWIIE
jgi:Tol biopolymer transport system component